MLNSDNIKNSKRVSIIIPCRNEEAYIGKVLENIISQNYPVESTEVLVVDGMSNDKTAEIIKGYSIKFPFIHYLENPDRVVPFALNKAIRQSTGEIVIRMDAHAVYPNDYVTRLVNGLSEYNCDNVGGVWITEPANSSLKAKGIALGTSHIFGIGNAYYRLNIANPKLVDTVPFGCYHRNVFEKIGYFDEDLIRNQDDEFNARLIKYGGKIYLLPDIQIIYFARDKLSKTSKMFYQYGLYKPLVNLKVGKPATMRQFAPLILILFLAVSLGLGFISNVSLSVFAIGSSFYLLSCLLASFSIWLKNIRQPGLLFYLFILFPLIHFSYGWGYLMGIIRFMIFNKKIHHSKMNENR